MNDSVKWWQKAVVYQIYPLSFKDSNHDGIGDILGIIEKLDYIKNLGVDVIWLSPIYQSPMEDNGYDISDYYQIDPVFGTFSDFLQLLKEVHLRDMKMIMDLVVNHTSDEHIWFKESKKSLDNPYRDYYIWKDKPTDISSVFSGSAWEFDENTKQYYFHLFSKKQPDLNWQNPKLRQVIYEMINYWLNLGIDGFRLDVIDLIGKDIEHVQIGNGPFLDQNLKELYDTCFKGRNIMTVGEMPTLSIQKAAQITNQNAPLLNMIFQFEHLSLDEIPKRGKWMLQKLDLIEFKAYFDKIQKTNFNHGWNSLFLSNHDQPRVVSRFGNLSYRKESAKMLATILYSMQGTPYVYQGEEIGMTGVRFQNISEYKDVETLNMYHEFLDKKVPMKDIMESIYAKSRDNSRTPMQWNNQLYAGFSDENPWLMVNPNYKEINATFDLEDQDGVFFFYKKLFEIRKSYTVFDLGDFNLIYPKDAFLFAYTRKYKEQLILVIGHFNNQEAEYDLEEFKDMDCLLTNKSSLKLSNKTMISPYYCAIYYKNH
ncbi:MAG: alpha-glucosidase [Firmicutes bacterium]|nr:alpha-glucosidase [Bacillota bacterium]